MFSRLNENDKFQIHIPWISRVLTKSLPNDNYNKNDQGDELHLRSREK